MPVIEREKLFFTQRQCNSCVEQVDAPHAHVFGVHRAKLLGFTKRVSPRNGHMGKDVVSQVGFNVLERDFPAGSVNLLSENREAKRVADAKKAADA